MQTPCGTNWCVIRSNVSQVLGAVTKPTIIEASRHLFQHVTLAQIARIYYTSHPSKLLYVYRRYLPICQRNISDPTRHAQMGSDLAPAPRPAATSAGLRATSHQRSRVRSLKSVGGSNFVMQETHRIVPERNGDNQVQEHQDQSFHPAVRLARCTCRATPNTHFDRPSDSVWLTMSTERKSTIDSYAAV